jgi:hypothetical protein
MYLLDLWRKRAAADEWVEAFCDLVLAWRRCTWHRQSPPNLRSRRSARLVTGSWRQLFPQTDCVIAIAERRVETMHPIASGQHTNSDALQTPSTRRVLHSQNEPSSDAAAALALGNDEFGDIEIPVAKFGLLLRKTRDETAGRAILRSDKEQSIIILDDSQQAVDVPRRKLAIRSGPIGELALEILEFDHERHQRLAISGDGFANDDFCRRHGGRIVGADERDADFASLLRIELPGGTNYRR